MLVNGATVKHPMEVRQAVYDHFRCSFLEHWHHKPKLMGPFKVIQQSQQFSSLEVEFSEDEIRAAVSDCNSNNSPGPDGFNMTCFQKGWKLKGDILSFLQEFNTNSSLVGGLNSSFITLVPKTDNPSGIQDFRPISLINSTYKILSKVLSNRMKIVLPDVIDTAQSAFLGKGIFWTEY